MSTPASGAGDFKAFERTAHDEVAEGYRDFFAEVTGYAVDALLDAAAAGSGASVLDVATGPGIVAARAASRGASRVVGIDIAPRMLALAAARCPGIEFRDADAERLPFADATFDAVVCNFGIGHFPHPEAATAEMARVVARGRSIALSWWDVPAHHRVNGIFFDAVAEARAPPPRDIPPGPPMFRFSEEAALADLLRSAGLVSVAVESHRLTHRLPSAEALWNGVLRGTVRTSMGIRRQPHDVQQRIRAAFDRLVLPYVADGELRVPVAFKIARGRRPDRGG